MGEVRVLSPTGLLGYGFPESSFSRGMEMNPHLIAVDGGSTDPGPYYLGSGKSFTDRAAVKRDLRIMLPASVGNGIPLVIGTAGGSGAADHLNWCRDIIEEIAEENGLSFRMGIIPADIEKQYVLDAYRKGSLYPLPCVPEADEAAITACTNIVAQMGIEPFIEALDQECDVILAGRAYDPVVFASLPVRLGYDPGPALHMGKIIECAAIAATPGSGSDSVMGILKEDCFELLALGNARCFTRQSVAAHSLYEKSDPRFLPGPGGRLNLTNCVFEESGGGKVRVSGSVFEPTEKVMVKIEGARRVGYRTISIAGARDPVMISSIAVILDEVRAQVQEIVQTEKMNGKLYFRVYGMNGVMGSMEPEPDRISHELGIVIEAVGDSQESADTICSIARSTLLHYGYPGRISTAGNLAFPFSPSDLSAGPCYEFALYHLIEYKEGMFRVSIQDVA